MCYLLPLVAAWAIDSGTVTHMTQFRFRFLGLIPKMVVPKKPADPKVELYKAELRKLVDETIAEVEKQIQRLQQMNADEASIRPWRENLELLREKRRKLGGFPKVCPVKRLKGVGEFSMPLLADTPSDLPPRRDHTSGISTQPPSPRSGRSRPSNQV